MPCPFTDKLADFQLWLLDGPEADAVAEHLMNDDCAECDAELEATSGVVSALEAWRHQRRTS